MHTASLAALDRRFRELDDVFDVALTSGNAAEVSRTSQLAQEAHDALYNAAPHTLADVIVVLKCVIGGIAASDDALGVDLIPRLRRLRVRLGRLRASAGLNDLVELRDIARASRAVCDGGGSVSWISQWLDECATCLGRPRLI